MANIVLTDAHITIDGVEYSSQDTTVAIAYSSEAIDASAMGSDTRTHLGGAKDWTMEFEFNADEATSGATLFDLVGAVVPVKVRPTSAVISAGNPSYEGNGLVTTCNPIGGAFGDLMTVSLSIVSAGPLARVAVAPV